MGRIEGTGAPERKRRRLPRVDLNWNLFIVLIFGPAVLRAPDPFLQAVCLAIALVAAATVGYYYGRSDLAMSMLREEYRKAADGKARKPDELRRDEPPAQ